MENNRDSFALQPTYNKKRGTLILPSLNNATNPKIYKFRPESPTSKEACNELGIDITQFIVLKSLEDFGGPGVTDSL